METRRSLAGFGIGALICCALLTGRIVVTGKLSFFFLFWNLFLAWIPLLAAIAFHKSIRRLPWLAALCFLVWLFFFPNAPYLATDFIHLKPRAPVPMWFDALLLTSFAVIGTAVGYLSLAAMHNWVACRFGGRVGWFFALGALGLCSVGIYVGRVLRWNSWHVVTRPIELVETTVTRVQDPFGNSTQRCFSL